jgi:hypothetical protein
MSLGGGRPADLGTAVMTFHEILRRLDAQPLRLDLSIGTPVIPAEL